MHFRARRITSTVACDCDVVVEHSIDQLSNLRHENETIESSCSEEIRVAHTTAAHGAFYSTCGTRVHCKWLPMCACESATAKYMSNFANRSDAQRPQRREHHFAAFAFTSHIVTSMYLYMWTQCARVPHIIHIYVLCTSHAKKKNRCANIKNVFISD